MRAIWIVMFALLGACAPSSEDIRADFDEHVARSSTCSVDADCAVISPGCPLGCFVAVRADAADACEAYARDRITAFERAGTSCDYDCVAPGTPRCEAGACVVDPAE